MNVSAFSCPQESPAPAFRATTTGLESTTGIAILGVALRKGGGCEEREMVVTRDPAGLPLPVFSILILFQFCSCSVDVTVCVIVAILHHFWR